MTEELIIERIKSRQKIEGEHFAENIFLDFTSENLNGTYDLEFVNCTFSKRLTIKEINAAHLFVTFENCTISDFYFINSEIYTLTVKNCSFLNFSLGKVDIIGYAKISMIGKITVDFRNISCHLFQFEYNDVQECSVRLHSPQIEDFNIYGLKEISSFDVNSAQNVILRGYFKNVQLNTDKLLSLEVDQHNSQSIFEDKDATIFINSIIENFRLFKLPGTSNLLLSDCDISSFAISHFIQSTGSIALFHTKILILISRETILKNLIFNDTQVSNWISLFSDISGIKYYNFDWPHVRFSVNLDPNEVINLNKEFRDLYRQLKVAAINMKNKPDELFFTQKELEYYERHLKEEQKGLREEKIVLKLDRISSLHGQSWWRPLWLLFVIHTFLFLFFKESRILNCNICLCEIRCLFISLFNNLSDYLTLIIPTHNLTIFKDLLPKDYIVSFLMRINTIYFSYHIVRSLRKYGNK